MKEVREARYWLQVLLRSGILPAEVVRPWLDEAQELASITAKSIVTARSRR